MNLNSLYLLEMCQAKLILLTVFISQSYSRTVNLNPLSSANNVFGLQLLNLLSETDDNVFVSPFSISNAFGMLYNGARGLTAQEIRQVLGYNNLTDQEVKEQFQLVLNEIKQIDSKKYELDVANRLMVNKNFALSKTFEEDATNYFKSSVKSANFVDEPIKTMNEINQWVSRQTRFKISQVLTEPLSPLTRLVIINAIYFKGVFETKFNKELTMEQPFHNSDGKQSTAQMMFRKGTFNHTVVPELDSQLLEIPYSGDDISLYVVLPNQRQGLKNLKNNLTDFAIIEKAISNLFEQKVTVSLPKFKFETKYELDSLLPALGMNIVFGNNADLSGITDNINLKVSKAIHKAFVEVNEEGTEAAAITVINSAIFSSFVRYHLTFKADHPFMFFIRDNLNGMVLFSGLIKNL